MPADNAVLDHAILGFVNERPRSGYDLKKAFDSSVAHFWPANQSQIYQTLARLLRQGMVEVRVQQQDGKPNRKVYHITAQGLEELRRWLRSPHALPDVRDSFLIQFYFADAVSKDDIVRLLQCRIDAHKKRLEFLRGAREEYIHHPPNGAWDRVLHPAIVDLGIGVEEAWLVWTEHAVAAVQALPPLRPPVDADAVVNAGKGGQA